MKGPKQRKISRRLTRQTGMRLFVDALEKLTHLAATKHRGRLNVTDLIREAIDQYLDREFPG